MLPFYFEGGEGLGQRWGELSRLNTYFRQNQTERGPEVTKKAKSIAPILNC